MSANASVAPRLLLGTESLLGVSVITDRKKGGLLAERASRSP